jgi:hypothetical protein
MGRVMRASVHLIAATVLALPIVSTVPLSAKSQIALGSAIAEAKSVYKAANIFLRVNECVGTGNQAAYDKLLDRLDDIISVLQNMWYTGKVQGGNLSDNDLALLWHDRKALEQRRDLLKNLPPCGKPTLNPSYQYRPGEGWEIEGYYAGGIKTGAYAGAASAHWRRSVRTGPRPASTVSTPPIR